MSFFVHQKVFSSSLNVSELNIFMQSLMLVHWPPVNIIMEIQSKIIIYKLHEQESILSFQIKENPENSHILYQLFTQNLYFFYDLIITIYFHMQQNSGLNKQERSYELSSHIENIASKDMMRQKLINRNIPIKSSQSSYKKIVLKKISSLRNSKPFYQNEQFRDNQIVQEIVIERPLQESQILRTEFNADNELQQFKVEQQQNKNSMSYVYNNYDIWDLTYSLVMAKLNKCLLFWLFGLQVLVRYFLLANLILLAIQDDNAHWQWIIIYFLTIFLYFICIVKVSLKVAETKSQFLLKNSFNSLEQSETSDYFQVVKPKKLLQSILRGLIPPELSFFYIKQKSQKRIQIYSMINFIYSSIEGIVFFPLFIIYAELIGPSRQVVSLYFYGISIFFIALSYMLFIILTIYLIVFGCKQKGLFQRVKQISKNNDQ